MHNTGSAAVHLVAIEHCLYASADAKRPDCALVRQEDVRFVECKDGKT